MNTLTQKYPIALRLTHAGLAIFGLCAYLSGELAEETEHGLTVGYWLHAYLGLTLTVFLISHIIGRLASVGRTKSGGLAGSGSYYASLREDIGQLIQFKLPVREDHGGLAGLVQVFGLLIFLWMSITGIILLYLGGPEVSDLAHSVAEAHEVGEQLIPIFLFLHIGAVILHSLAGHAIWQRMNPFTK